MSQKQIFFFFSPPLAGCHAAAPWLRLQSVHSLFMRQIVSANYHWTPWPWLPACSSGPEAHVIDAGCWNWTAQHFGPGLCFFFSLSFFLSFSPLFGPSSCEEWIMLLFVFPIIDNEGYELRQTVIELYFLICSETPLSCSVLEVCVCVCVAVRLICGYSSAPKERLLCFTSLHFSRGAAVWLLCAGRKWEHTAALLCSM